jgi:hypothetical protein
MAGVENPDRTSEKDDEPQLAPQPVPAARTAPEAAGDLAFHRLGGDLSRR